MNARSRKKRLAYTNDAGSHSFLKIRFISDTVDRKIRNLCRKYDLPVKLVSTPNSTLYSSLKTKNIKRKHNDCDICNVLPPKFTCTDRFVVYKFSCRH